MTVGLIVANVLVYLWEISKPGLNTHVESWGYYPCAVEGPCTTAAAQQHHEVVETVFSSMFMHAGIVHIGGNMLFLWIFGNNVEDALGRVRFLIWYLLAGIAATALQTFVTLHYGTAADASIPNVGASGAIAAVLGAYLVLLPHARVTTLLFGFLPWRLSAGFFLIVWFVFQLWQSNFSITHADQGGGVAFAAHVGGFVFGALAVKAFQVRAPLGPRRRA